MRKISDIARQAGDALVKGITLLFGDYGLQISHSSIAPASPPIQLQRDRIPSETKKPKDEFDLTMSLAFMTGSCDLWLKTQKEQAVASGDTEALIKNENQREAFATARDHYLLAMSNIIPTIDAKTEVSRRMRDDHFLSAELRGRYRGTLVARQESDSLENAALNDLVDVVMRVVPENNVAAVFARRIISLLAEPKEAGDYLQPPRSETPSNH